MDGQSNPSAVRARSAASRRCEAVPDRGGVLVLDAALQRGQRRRRRTAACSSRSSARRAAEVAARGPRLELGQRGREGRVELQGGLAAAPGVDVLARAQRELLAGQRRRRGRPSSAPRRSWGRSAASRRRPRRDGRELERLDPAPVGHLVALAVADAHDDRLLAAHLAHVRVGGGGALHVQHAVEDGHRRLRLGLAGRAQPALGGGLVGERLGGDEGHAPGGDRRGLGGGGPAPAAAQPAALRARRAWRPPARARSRRRARAAT